ncbi:hypothetical protein Hte_012032 [Hypoxylon texense]
MNSPSPSPKSPNEGQVFTIDTNNFDVVLKEFDEEGYIIDDDTRLQIPCAICNEKDLAILNGKFDRRTRATHESYTVLPNCKHAFGYTCLWDWIMEEINRKDPTCPTCRAAIFPYARWRLPLFGESSIEEQPQDIVGIRDSIRNAPTAPDEPDSPASESDNARNIFQATHEAIHRILEPNNTPNSYQTPNEMLYQILEPRPALLQCLIRFVANAIDQETALPTGCPIAEEDLSMIEDAISRFRIVRDGRPSVVSGIRTIEVWREAWDTTESP